MEDINNIAKYVITQCCQKEKAISNMKLQKVLYFIQGKSFFLLGEPAFEEDIFAYKFGVVIPKIYFEFSTYASEPICRQYKEVNINNLSLESIIDEVIKETINKKSWELLRETIKEGTPYYKFYKEIHNSIIPKSEIKKFFT